MKHWLRDTLFKRLFVLMWVALVVSHLVAFLVVVHTGSALPRPAMPDAVDLPPGLPPQLPPGGQAAFPGAPPGDPHARPPGRRPAGTPAFPTLPSLPPTPGLGAGQPSLPAPQLVLDYGLRLLIIGAAAWWGARWLSSPMRRLARASEALAASLRDGREPPQLDERHGTAEVREAAAVFNQIGRQLHEQFRGRSLLMAAISHDLRTPLTRMRMRLEASADDPATARSIADIREMDALLESALDVFRGMTVDEPPQATDVFALAQSLTDDLQELGHPVSLRGGPAIARAQPAALRRVLDNLLSNALRYGGAAEVTVLQDASGVQVLVDDEGPGIAPAQLEAVFQPFFRLEGSRNRATGGSGLGLFIARDLMARLGGTLALANRPGGGLRASVRLPR